MLQAQAAPTLSVLRLSSPAPPDFVLQRESVEPVVQQTWIKRTSHQNICATI